MKVLLTHRYFWPDTPPYAAILRTIGIHLAAAGHEVHVFASRPSYGGRRAAPWHEEADGLRIARCWTFLEDKRWPVRRLLNVPLYCARLFLHILRLRPDLVTASSFPPVLAAWCASLAARLVGARFVYHVMDIHPEVSRHAGGALGRGLAFRMLRALDMQTLRRAAAVVVLSEDMAETLRDRDRTIRLPIRVINNFGLDAGAGAAAPPAGLAKPAGARRAIFAGNLGRFQNLPLLAEGVARQFEGHPELQLMFLGSGAVQAELEARWGGHPQVVFGPFLPFSEAAPLIAGSDVGLVSLSPGLFRVAYPSKMQTYLDLGVPVLALVEPESELARTIEAEALGAVPRAAEPEAIGEALETVLGGDFRPSVVRYRTRHLAREAILGRWAALMGEMQAR